MSNVVGIPFNFFAIFLSFLIISLKFMNIQIKIFDLHFESLGKIVVSWQSFDTMFGTLGQLAAEI